MKHYTSVIICKNENIKHQLNIRFYSGIILNKAEVELYPNRGYAAIYREHFGSATHQPMQLADQLHMDLLVCLCPQAHLAASKQFSSEFSS